MEPDKSELYWGKCRQDIWEGVRGRYFHWYLVWDRVMETGMKIGR